MNTEAIRMKMLSLNFDKFLMKTKMELPLLKKNLNLAYEESSKINGHDSESSNEKEVIQKDPSKAIGHSSTKGDLEGITKVIGQQIDSRKRKHSSSSRVA